MRRKSISNASNCNLDIAAIRDEVVDYLVKTSVGRQGEIAAIIGVRRETICGYSTGRRELNDIPTLQALYEWMQSDKQRSDVTA